MKLQDVCNDLVLCTALQGTVFITWDLMERWPQGALSYFQEIGWLKPASPASKIVCPGCEEQCSMPVKIRPATSTLPIRAVIQCDHESDLGLIRIEPYHLDRWSVCREGIALWLSSKLGFKGKVASEVPSIFLLGKIHRKKALVPKNLHFDKDGPCLEVNGHSFPLAEVITQKGARLVLAKDYILKACFYPPSGGVKRKSTAKSAPLDEAKKGTAEWFSERSSIAANARHNQPGGTRAVKQKVIEEWRNSKDKTKIAFANRVASKYRLSVVTISAYLRNTQKAE